MISAYMRNPSGLNPVVVGDVRLDSDEVDSEEILVLQLFWVAVSRHGERRMPACWLPGVSTPAQIRNSSDHRCPAWV